MSTKNEEKGLGIVEKIMKLLKLDDAGKVEKFFRKEIKKHENVIRDTNNLLTAMGNAHEAKLQEIDDKLEDARESLEATYTDVLPANVATNDAMESFAYEYWSRVDAAEDKVKRLEEHRKILIEKYDKEVEATKEKIAKAKARIDKIK